MLSCSNKINQPVIGRTLRSWCRNWQLCLKITPSVRMPWDWTLQPPSPDSELLQLSGLHSSAFPGCFLTQITFLLYIYNFIFGHLLFTSFGFIWQLTVSRQTRNMGKNVAVMHTHHIHVLKLGNKIKHCKQKWNLFAHMWLKAVQITWNLIFSIRIGQNWIWPINLNWALRLAMWMEPHL